MTLRSDIRQIETLDLCRYFGRVKHVRRDSVRVFLPGVKVGTLCEVRTPDGCIPIEIVSLDPEGHVAMPLNEMDSVQLGDPVYILEESATLPVSDELLGRVIDSTGKPYDDLGPIREESRVPLYGESLNPLRRELISEALDLGVRSINAFLTCGKGQRQGIFAGSGVGKSVLLGMMARYTKADVVVVGLIGERGREVREFIEHELGEEGLRRSVIVVETADKSPVRRVRGAYAATAVAEYFRSKGLNVLLLMDSLTRFGMAQREIGMAAGEPPTSKGYTPSVFNALSKLAERAGNWGAGGSITGLYTVLVEGDDLEDPIADAARAILDGHIVLSRRLANRGQYPAVDILTSVSRVMPRVTENKHVESARKIKELLATFVDKEDLIQFGGYQIGSDLRIDESIQREPMIQKFLSQRSDEHASLYEAKNGLEAILLS